MFSLFLSIYFNLHLALFTSEQGKFNSLFSYGNEIFGKSTSWEFQSIFPNPLLPAALTLAEQPQSTGEMITSPVNAEADHQQQLILLFSLLAILSLTCLLLVFFLVKARLKLRIEKFRLMRYHAKQDRQQKDIAEQEVLLDKLRSSNQQLQETRNAFLLALSDDLSNPIAVIKNNYLDWFQQARFDQDVLEKALATESSIAKVEQLIQHAQVVTQYAKKTTSTGQLQGEQCCNLNRTLAILLQNFPLADHGLNMHFEAPGDTDYIVPIEDQALLIYISFYLHLLVKHVPCNFNLQVLLQVQENKLALLICSDTTPGDISPAPQPEKESGYFLIESLGKQLDVATSLFDRSSPGQLLKICFPSFIAQSGESWADEETCPPQIFFEAYQEPVLSKSGPNSDSPKCLILDPCPEMQMCLTQILSQHFNCKGVFNLQAGLNKIVEWQPDIIIMEPVQGRDNGFDLLQKFFSVPDNPTPPVIIISSRDSTAHRLKALDLDIHLFFGKPFNKELLFESARKLHSNYARRQQTQEVKENVPFQQSRDAIFLAQLNRLIETQINNAEFRFEDYFEQFALSKRQFFRRVNNLTRCTPKQYLIQKRLELARHLLGRGCLLQEVTRRCGFKNSQSLLKMYHAHFGEEPV